MNSELNQPSLFGMFNKPTQQFESIKKNPLILKPLIVVTLFYMAGVLSVALLTLDERIMGGKEIPSDIVLAKMFFIYGATISSFFTEAIKILIISLIFLAIAKISRKPATFKEMFSMFTHLEIVFVLIAFCIFLIEISVNGGLSSEWSWGSEVVMLLLAVWQMIFVAKGLKTVAHFSNRIAWPVAAVYFLCILLLYLGQLYTVCGLEG